MLSLFARLKDNIRDRGATLPLMAVVFFLAFNAVVFFGAVVSESVSIVRGWGQLAGSEITFPVDEKAINYGDMQSVLTMDYVVGKIAEHMKQQISPHHTVACVGDLDLPVNLSPQFIGKPFPPDKEKLGYCLVLLRYSLYPIMLTATRNDTCRYFVGNFLSHDSAVAYVRENGLRMVQNYGVGLYLLERP